MMTNGKIGVALVGGYLLGRTKKAKLAMGLGMFLAGKKLNLDPRQLARMAADSPVLSGVSGQVRQELLDSTKSAATAALTNRANSLADTLQERTAGLREAAPAGRPQRGEDAEEDADGPPEEDADGPPEEEADGLPEEEAEASGAEPERGQDQEPDTEPDPEPEGEPAAEPDPEAPRRAKAAARPRKKASSTSSSSSGTRKTASAKASAKAPAKPAATRRSGAAKKASGARRSRND